MDVPITRRIRAIIIDDNPPEVSAPEIDIQCLGSLSAVQDWLPNARDIGADLIVCDVNMEDRNYDHPPDVSWGRPESLPAYGPILALPFLSTRSVCEFVPISSWWARVQNDGYVLVPMALLLSAISGRAFTLSAAREWIREQVHSRSWLEAGATAEALPTAQPRGTTDPHMVLTAGLTGLRLKLRQACKEGRLTIAGLEATIECLKAWKRGPLIEGDGAPIRVEIIYPDRGDLIEATSLFADYMEFRSAPRQWEIDRIIEELKEWRAEGFWFQFPRSTGLYELAAGLLANDLPREHDQTKPAPWHHNRLKGRAKAASKSSGIDQHCLIRTAIIFAFARAWYFTSLLHGVYDTEERRHEDVEDWAYWFLDIDPHHDPVNRFKRLLGKETKKKGEWIVIGSKPTQRPFDPKATDAFEAYSALKKNVRLDLNPIEKAMARRFILDADRFFPSGMDEKDRVLWEPHLDEMPAYPKWLT